jgi:hypothetical protein
MSENETILSGQAQHVQSSTVRRWRDENTAPATKIVTRQGRAFPLLVGGLAGAIIGLLISTLPARVYEASTRVSLPAPAAGDKPNQGIDALRQRLVSDDVLRRVVVENSLIENRDLAAKPKDKTSADISDVIANLRRRVAVHPVGTDLAEIRVRTDNADQAARITDALANAVASAPVRVISAVPTINVPSVPVSPLVTAPGANTSLPTVSLSSAPSGIAPSALVQSLSARLDAAIAVRRAAEVAVRNAARTSVEPEVINGTGTTRERYETAISEVAAARIRSLQAQATLSAARRALTGEIGDPNTAPPELRGVAIQLSTFARIEAGLGNNPAARNEVASLRRLLLVDTQRAAQTAANDIAVSQEMEARAVAEIARLRSKVAIPTAQVKSDALIKAEQELFAAKAVERALSEALNRPLDAQGRAIDAVTQPVAQRNNALRQGQNIATAQAERLASSSSSVMADTSRVANAARATTSAVSALAGGVTSAGASGSVLSQQAQALAQAQAAAQSQPPVALSVVSPAKIPVTPLHPPVLAIVLASVVAGLSFGAYVASRRKA